MTATPGVLLDIDGTLLDSSYLHGVAWLRAFRDHGYDVTSARVHRAIGLGDDHLVPHVVDRDDPAVADAHGERFAELQPEVRALPGAAELVRRCAQDRRVVLATSGKAKDLDWMLDTIGARDAIAGSTTADDVADTKPAPDVLTAALTAHDLDPAATVTIGDSVWDGQAAQAAGVTFVGLLCGGFSAAELRRAGAVATYEDPADLLARYDTSPLGADWSVEPAAPPEPGPHDRGGSGGMATREA
ncbi:HAD family hydrolase [Rhodococcus aerolatus]